MQPRGLATSYVLTPPCSFTPISCFLSFFFCFQIVQNSPHSPPLQTQPSPGEYSAEVSTTEDGVAGVLTVSRVSSDEVEFTFTTAADKDAEEVAHLAQAKRVDIDLEGTMWKLYVEGNWAPGVDEAVAFAFTWTTENQDLVMSTLPTPPSRICYF